MNKFYLIIIVTFILLQKAFPQVEISYQGNLCQNNLINFYGKSVVEVSDWNWDFGDGFTSTEQNPTHIYTDLGTFEVKLSIIVASNGNTYNTSQNIIISANPEVGFIIDSTHIYYSTYSRVFIDTSILYNPISSYLWDFGDSTSPTTTDSTSVMYKYNNKGLYEVWLKATDIKGCTDSTSNMVTINDRFFIPNVFTPNGDTKNDQFIITSNGITLFSIEIYSRWGNLVFKRSGHQQIIWDGRLPEGSLVKPGTYYYVVSSESGDISYEPEKGYITVIY